MGTRSRTQSVDPAQDLLRPQRPALIYRTLNGVLPPCDGVRSNGRSALGDPIGGEEIADPEAALARINGAYALAPLSMEEVDLRHMALANDQLDRSRERFSVAYLQRLAATLPGKPVLAHHDKGSFPLGRFYAAYVARDAETGVTWLMARWYLLRLPENESLRRQLDAGIYAYVSIGFRGGDLICDLCGGSFWGDCPHWPGETVLREGTPATCTMTWQDTLGTAEAVEGSLVWLGAQVGARNVKEAAPRGPVPGSIGRGDRSPPAPARRLRKDSDASDAQLQFDFATEQRAASTEHRERSELAEDGALYRRDLAAEIARLAGLIGAEREAEALCETLASHGAARLKELREEYERRVDALFPPVGTGRPAAPEGGQPSAPRVNPRAYRVV
jgi:hypothetical protein